MTDELQGPAKDPDRDPREPAQGKPGPGESYPSELRDQARELRQRDAAHWTHKRIAEHLGVSEKAVARWVKRDGAPKPRGRPKGSKSKPPSESVKTRTMAIEATLSQVLSFPAIPSQMLAPSPEGRAFLTSHFLSAGPRTAHTMATVSEHPDLHDFRDFLEGLTKGSVRATIAVAVIGYAAPPILWLFGMQMLAMGVAQAGGLDETELASMFQAQNVPAPPIVTEPPQPDPADGQGATPEPAPAD